MLEIRPNCEYCGKDLAINSTQAMICSYECTFCQQCVENVLKNVCPNCGGGFTHRPIRPAIAHRTGLSIKHQPALTKRTNTKLSQKEITDFADTIKDTTPENR